MGCCVVKTSRYGVLIDMDTQTVIFMAVMKPRDFIISLLQVRTRPNSYENGLEI
jgi:hypothetical protein